MAAPADNGRDGPFASLDDVGRETEHVLRYRVEIERRLAAGGLGSVADALGLFERLRVAIDGVSAAEIAWTRERVDRIVARLEAYAGDIASLRQLKRRIGG